MMGTSFADTLEMPAKLAVDGPVWMLFQHTLYPFSRMSERRSNLDRFSPRQDFDAFTNPPRKLLLFILDVMKISRVAVR
jgi:hypothetical protein